MNNPLPVDPFNAPDAARRTWPQLIESMLEAVCLVEPDHFRIVAANAAAGRLLGHAPADLVGFDMPSLAATPEDDVFWREAARGRLAGLVSESIVVGAGERMVPVMRRVTRVEPAPGNVLYVVAWHDRSAEVAAMRRAEEQLAELRATLESLADGVLVTDRAGRIVAFNRRFAALWSIGEALLEVRDDAELYAWMAAQVAEPRAYAARLEAIDAEPLLQAAEPVALASGVVLQRSTAPQLSRGQPIGRVWSFRPLTEGDRRS